MKTTAIVISSLSSSSSSSEDCCAQHYYLAQPTAAEVSAASASAPGSMTVMDDDEEEEEEDEQLEYSDDDCDASSSEPPCIPTSTSASTTAHTSGTPRTTSTRHSYDYCTSECHVVGEVDDDRDPQPPRRRALIPITRELKIDELDHRGIVQEKTVGSRSPTRQSQLGGAGGTTTGAKNKSSSAAKVAGCLIPLSSKDSSSMHAVPCACCKSYVRCKDHSTNNNKYNKNLIASHVLGASQKNDNDDDDCCAGHGEGQKTDDTSKSSFSALFESLLWPSGGAGAAMTSAGEHQQQVGSTKMRGDHDKSNIQQESHHGPSSPTDFSYTVVKCLMESWLHKKGSGNDVFGSTSWKPRWCQLVLAEVHGYSGQVPLLLASWHSSMPKPSTIIVLDEKIAIAIDALGDGGVSSFFAQNTATGKQQENEQCYRFDIASDSTISSNCSNGDPKSLMTRTFSAANVDLRNDWVQKLNDTISTYGRFKKSMALKNVTSQLPPISPRTKTSSREYSHLEGLDLVY